MIRNIKLLVENWPAKLLCLLLALGVWTLVKQQYVSQDPGYRKDEIRRSHP